MHGGHLCCSLFLGSPLLRIHLADGLLNEVRGACLHAGCLDLIQALRHVLLQLPHVVFVSIHVVVDVGPNDSEDGAQNEFVDDLGTHEGAQGQLQPRLRSAAPRRP